MCSKCAKSYDRIFHHGEHWNDTKAASFDADQGRHFVRWGCMDGYVNSGNGCDLCDLPVNELSKSPIFNPLLAILVAAVVSFLVCIVVPAVTWLILEKNGSLVQRIKGIE